MRDKEELMKHELIGLQLEVISSKNMSLIGLKGKIIDETKNTITVQAKNQKDPEDKKIQKKVLLKNSIKMVITFKSNKIEIDGQDLMLRPEDRIKR